MHSGGPHGFALMPFPSTFVQRLVEPEPLTCTHNPMCIDKKPPLLKNIRTSPIDPDTPDSVMRRIGDNGKSQRLVFSDEFNDPGRTFYDGDDPYWQAMDLWYGATMDLEWYDPDAVTTRDGVLQITFDAFANHGLNYRSGMLQSWNKMCFKGGFLEASISLPGTSSVPGFWPGFWTMGNLGRPGFLATADGLWPYSYADVCDAGITPNQSSADGLSHLPGMRLPACTCPGADHPTPGRSRTAPEIDALEASVEPLDGSSARVGTASQSFQTAPFDVWYRPDHEHQEVYDSRVTRLNRYAGGPFQQALSGLTTLHSDWYDGKAYQSYGFDYSPGATGSVAFTLGGTKTWKTTGQSIRPNGNIGQRVLPEEPLSIILNLGMSPGFSAIDFAALRPLMPAALRVDYVRIYQDAAGELTCDPAGYATTPYIAAHPAPYANPNLTRWYAAFPRRALPRLTDASRHDTEHEQPRNAFMHACQAAAPSPHQHDARAQRAKRAPDTSARSWRRPWS